MCLGVPVKLEQLLDGNMGIVMLGGVRRKLDLSLLDEPRSGDYVLAHAGFAIEKIDPEEAERTLELLREIAGAAE